MFLYPRLPARLAWMNDKSYTLNMGGPQGCFLSLDSLYTQLCGCLWPNTIIKFTDETAVVGLITDQDERVCWETVEKFKYPEVDITEDLTGSVHTNTLNKETLQHFFYLWHLPKFRMSLHPPSGMTAAPVRTRRSCREWYSWLNVRLGGALSILEDIYTKRCKTKVCRIITDLIPTVVVSEVLLPPPFPTHPFNIYTTFNICTIFWSLLDISQCVFSCCVYCIFWYHIYQTWGAISISLHNLEIYLVTNKSLKLEAALFCSSLPHHTVLLLRFLHSNQKLDPSAFLSKSSFLKEDLHVTLCRDNLYDGCLWIRAAQSACCLIIDQGPINLNHSAVLKGWELEGSCLLECGSSLNQGLVSPGPP